MTRLSDHALLRFVEGATGIDMERARADIEASFERCQAVADELGLTTYGVRSDGHVYVVRRGVITTIVPDKGPRSRFRVLAPCRPND